MHVELLCCQQFPPPQKCFPAMKLSCFWTAKSISRLLSDLITTFTTFLFTLLKTILIVLLLYYVLLCYVLQFWLEKWRSKEVRWFYRSPRLLQNHLWAYFSDLLCHSKSPWQSVWNCIRIIIQVANLWPFRQEKMFSSKIKEMQIRILYLNHSIPN